MVGSNFFRSYGFWHYGEGFQTVLFTWYMAFHSGLSATQIGLYQALVLSPFLIFTIFGGAITDWIGAKIIFFVSTTLYATLLISYGFLDLQFGFIPELFLVYCILSGIFSAFSNPALDTFILGATDQSNQENALFAATSHNAGKLSGNVTGLLLPLLSTAGAFLLNGFLIAVSVLFLQSHKKPKGQRAPKSDSDIQLNPKIFRKILRHFRTCPENFDIFLSSAMLGLLIVPSGYILLPLALREKLPNYGDWIAFLGIASWVGAIIATSAAKQVSSKILRPGFISLLVWSSFGIALIFLMFAESFVALSLVGFAFGAANVGKALVYGKYLHNSPKEEQGLFVAVDQTAFWGLATIGTAIMGALVDTYGLNSAIQIVSCTVFLCIGFLTVRGRISALTQA